MSSSTVKGDVFGTYLEGVTGLTIVDKILSVMNRVHVRTMGELAAELGAMPEEIVSAVLQAERSGLVKLETKGDETIVTLVKPAVA